jgi:hypothetical protein
MSPNKSSLPMKLPLVGARPSVIMTKVRATAQPASSRARVARGCRTEVSRGLRVPH